MIGSSHHHNHTESQLNEEQQTYHRVHTVPST